MVVHSVWHLLANKKSLIWGSSFTVSCHLETYICMCLLFKNKVCIKHFKLFCSYIKIGYLSFYTESCFKELQFSVIIMTCLFTWSSSTCYILFNNQPGSGGIPLVPSNWEAEVGGSEFELRDTQRTLSLKKRRGEGENYKIIKILCSLKICGFKILSLFLNPVNLKPAHFILNSVCLYVF